MLDRFNCVGSDCWTTSIVLGQIFGLFQLCWVRFLVCFNCVGSDFRSVSIVLGQIVGPLLLFFWPDCKASLIALGQIVGFFGFGL